MGHAVDRSVAITERGRFGGVRYREPAHGVVFHREFGGGRPRAAGRGSTSRAGASRSGPRCGQAWLRSRREPNRCCVVPRRRAATRWIVTEACAPGLHRDPSKDRYRIGVFLVPLDGSSGGRLAPIAGNRPAADFELAKFLAHDGRTPWFDVAGLGGVDLRIGARVAPRICVHRSRSLGRRIHRSGRHPQPVCWPGTSPHPPSGPACRRRTKWGAGSSSDHVCVGSCWRTTRRHCAAPILRACCWSTPRRQA